MADPGGAGRVRQQRDRKARQTRRNLSMRVLYFSPRNFWASYTGAHLRDFYLVRELAKRASVSFLGIADLGDDSNYSSLQPNRTDIELERVVVSRRRAGGYTLWKKLRGLVGPTPINVLNYDDRNVKGDLCRLLAEHDFDVVQIEQVQLSSYVPLLRSARSRPVIVCDWHNLESELMQRYGQHASSLAHRIYAQRTYPLLRKAEQRLLAECDAHTVVSERDKQRLQELAPQAVVQVVENGVDTSYYFETPSKPAGVAALPSRNVVFVGSMDFHANIDAVLYFASEIWPGLHKLIPDLRFLVVGSRPAPEIRSLEQLPGIVVTGTVEDVRPYYRDALAAVAPLRIGGGTRLKILEAMAASVPVVATSLGAEGLAVRPGRDLLLADTPGEMTQALLQLFRSPGLRQSLSQAGGDLVRGRYDWSVIGSKLYEVHNSLVEHRSYA